MCGIAGFCTPHTLSSASYIQVASSMGAAISHRGPDSSGTWFDKKLSVALNHQRLAILDLTTAGHQPMTSVDGSLTLIFNGEIYNHMDLRRQLDKASQHVWRSSSDTETLLVAIKVWGVDLALQRLAGMFAFALVDLDKKTLFLARDRFGEKPLYWGTTGNGHDRTFFFASDLSALKQFPKFNNQVSARALQEFMRFCYIPSPLSIYQDIWKLEPGHYLSLPLPFTPNEPRPSPKPWWTASTEIDTCLINRPVDFNTSVAQLDLLLSSIVSEQSASDVPLGTFLSGGLDSSLITALAQSQSDTPISTYTIGFADSRYNEAPFAKTIARHLCTSHHEFYLSADLALSLIPQLPYIYSEPFADSSQIPTTLVCQQTSNSGLKVALSGDGGDELFSGYNRYTYSQSVWNKFTALPSIPRTLLAHLFKHLPPRFLDALFFAVPINNLGQKLNRIASRLLAAHDVDELYFLLVSEWSSVNNLFTPSFLMSEGLSAQLDLPIHRPCPSVFSESPIQRMMYRDTVSYLPDDILVKVDRSAMSCGLETRAPFLDHRIASFAWSLPLTFLQHPKSSKYILRQLLTKYIPSSLFDRPKSGFAIPLTDWLRGPLHSWSESLLEPSRLYNQEIFNPEMVSKLWLQHQSGKYDHTNKLWAILMFQSWLDR